MVRERATALPSTNWTLKFRHQLDFQNVAIMHARNRNKAAPLARALANWSWWGGGVQPNPEEVRNFLCGGILLRTLHSCTRGRNRTGCTAVVWARQRDSKPRSTKCGKAYGRPFSPLVNEFKVYRLQMILATCQN